ncbi:MAG: LLM class F420-dependent oxidoreductase [Gammaproteobacteria bacterium]|nr:LLM class F420-dependent oxidoreductase [Gammaproteobacteria bacterium]
MKLCVEFPSVAYREGAAAVKRLASGIEAIGYDQIEIFDHVVMGYPREDREDGPYPAKMPILEAFMFLAYAAAVTDRIGLGTEVLVLPQRQPILVAKQISTLDTLSQGRVRLGVGVGWQPSEFDALGESFKTRGKRMDDAIRLLRSAWADERINFQSEHYRVEDMGMEPKSPQGGKLPIWIGGYSEAAFRRVGELGDGWLASRISDASSAREAISRIHEHAARCGRAPSDIGLQSMVAPPPRNEQDKRFYTEPERVVARAVELREMGFDWVSLNATAIFQAGARSVDGMLERLEQLHTDIRSATA